MNRAGPMAAAYDVDAVRADFPVLHQQVHGHPLAYLDNAATTQKPRQVIEAIAHYYEADNANVHRGVHLLSERATRAYEAARENCRRMVNARSTKEVVFTRGTTEAINLVAQAHARPTLKQGDEIVISHLEHHSNIVPWQMVARQTGATLRVIPAHDDGSLDLSRLDEHITERARMVSIGHVSNALGTVHDVRAVLARAREVGATTLVDGAQAVPHLGVDVQALDCDFYAFSGHKMYGPTGIGCLVGRENVLEGMEPYQGGGDMIASVTFEETTYNELPYRFEAGTPNIAGAIGLGAAIDYLQALGIDRVHAHEDALLRDATERLSAIPEVRLIGTAPHKASVLGFTIEGVHPHDVGSLLDHEGIAIRTGHHCAQPAMDRFGVPATNRASFGLYNNHQEVERLEKGVKQVIEVFT